MEHRLAAILSADVVGYSRLMAEDEDVTVRTLAEYRDEIALLVRQHRGRVVDSPGDNLLAELPTATDAVGCAVAIQRVVAARNSSLAAERKMVFRIGVHLGEVASEGERLHGHGVNVAARLQALAEPGGICVSGAVREQVGGKLPVSYQDMGAQSLKNIPERVHAYRVRPELAERLRTSTFPRRIAAGVTGAALIAIAIATYFSMGPRSTTETGAPLTSLAVLPFDDMSPDADSAWLANGMAEELIETLSRVSAFRVVARTSAEIAKRSGDDLRAIGGALAVGSLVEGSVRRSGDQIRITAQLIRVSDASHLWSARYDRKLDDVFAIQQEIARDIAEAIRVELGVRTSWSWLEREQFAPRDVRAYELVRKGWDLQLTWQRADIERAGELFREAIKIDPAYAVAHASLAWHDYMLWSRWDFRDGQKRRAIEGATRALELDPDSSGANHLLALISLREWDWSAAEARLLASLRVHPEHAGTREAYGLVLADTRRSDEACVEFRRASELDPLYAGFHQSLAMCHAVRGEYDAAIAKAEDALALNPQLPYAPGQLALYHHLNGNDEAALEAQLRGALVDAEVETALRRGFRDAGWRGMNAAFIALLAARSGRPCFLEPGVGVQLYANAGMTDEMYRCIELAIAERGNWGLGLTWSPTLAPYRAEPRFVEILRRVGLAE